MSGRGRGRGQGHCIEYKFLGTCEKYEKGKCSFRHERKEQYTYRDYIQIPAGLSVGMVVGSGGSNLKQLSSIAQCCVKVKPEEMRVLIVTANRAKLPLLVEKMKLLMSQERTSGPSWCYIHPGGITSQGFYKFRPYGGRIPPRARDGGITIYELCSDVQESAESELVQKLAAMSPLTEDDTSTGLRTALHRVHGDIPVGAEGTKWTQRTRIHLNPKENILERLTESLDLLCQKKREGPFVTRLDARFGKVTWGRFPEEVYSTRYNIEELANLLFAKDIKHMNIFNTDVKSANADFVRTKQKSHKPYLVETFDVKVTCVDGGDRLDVRLLVKRNDHGETILRVLMVKKNEIKDVTFDILNLHRQHDVRIGLHHYRCVQDGDRLYGVVKEMLGKISFLPRHKVRIHPKTSRWNIHFIRHKKKLTYPLNDKFALTIADVSEHTFNVKTAEESEEFDMRMETKATHAEVEVHNLSWECAFGRDMGFTPDQSLMLHMERGSVDAGQFDSIPHPWHPELILRDYDDFWGHLDRLNSMLDGK